MQLSPHEAWDTLGGSSSVAYRIKSAMNNCFPSWVVLIKHSMSPNTVRGGSFFSCHHPHPRLHLRNFHLQHVECNICGCKCPQSHGSDGKHSICVATLDSQYSLYSNVDTFLTFDKDSLFLVFWFFMGLETVETVEIRLAVFAVNCSFLARGKIWANSLFF